MPVVATGYPEYLVEKIVTELERIRLIGAEKKDFIVYLDDNGFVQILDLQIYNTSTELVYFAVLPSDAFILKVFINAYEIMQTDSDTYSQYYTKKELFIKENNYMNLDWIYKEDFRKKDDIFVLLW